MSILETLMLVCFGISWPFAIAKTLRSRTAKGKSLVFLCLVLVGYGFGVANKLINATGDAVVHLWTLNGLMVACDFALSLYYRHTRDQRPQTETDPAGKKQPWKKP